MCWRQVLRHVQASIDNPIGFPAWLRLTHFVNLALMLFLVRSGLSILIHYPRLYWNHHRTPGSDWIRFTPLEVPKDRVWTAKDDSRDLSPWMKMVRPLPQARVVVFRSYGEDGGETTTNTLGNATHPESLLAYEMNYEPLPDLHGVLLRLRVENHLEFETVKWIRSIQFVISGKTIGKGYGGKNEDDEYYPMIANIDRPGPAQLFLRKLEILSLCVSRNALLGGFQTRSQERFCDG